MVAQRPLRCVKLLAGLLGETDLTKPEEGLGGWLKNKRVVTKQTRTRQITQNGAPAGKIL